MKIKVSNKNEFEIIPDIGNNKELKKEEQFKIIFKKLSTLSSSQWSSVGHKNDIKVDLKEKLRLSIIRLVNPPILIIDDKEVELTIDILLSEQYPELFDLENILITEMARIENDTKIDIKK